MQAQTMRRIRQYHLYLGVFFAPMIIFFAFSGALQTFRLQEEKGWGSTPPDWIVWMAAVHKDQSLPRAKPAKAAGAEAAKPGGDHAEAAPASKPAAQARERAPSDPPKRKSKLPLQIFTVLLATGLIFSALLGMAIALNAKSTRRLSIVMAIAGIVVPFVLL